MKPYKEYDDFEKLKIQENRQSKSRINSKSYLKDANSYNI